MSDLLAHIGIGGAFITGLTFEDETFRLLCGMNAPCSIIMVESIDVPIVYVGGQFFHKLLIAPYVLNNRESSNPEITDDMKKVLYIHEIILSQKLDKWKKRTNKLKHKSNSDVGCVEGGCLLIIGVAVIAALFYYGLTT